MNKFQNKVGTVLNTSHNPEDIIKDRLKTTPLSGIIMLRKTFRFDLSKIFGFKIKK